MKKFISNITVASLAFLPMVVNAQGQGLIDLKSNASDVTSKVYNKTIDTNASVTGPIIIIINWILSFLGIAAIVLVIYGGILWMTSAGEDKGAKKGKEVIKNAVIGLAIILGAYVIVNFVLTALFKLTT